MKVQNITVVISVQAYIRTNNVKPYSAVPVAHPILLNPQHPAAARYEYMTGRRLEHSRAGYSSKRKVRRTGEQGQEGTIWIKKANI